MNNAYNEPVIGTMSEQSAFRNFSEFYPYYLEEHSDVTCRRLHFVGSLLVIALALYALTSGKLVWLLLLPVIGYGFAWVGHYVFEKNRPATFKYLLYSLMGDWVMFRDILIGRIRF